MPSPKAHSLEDTLTSAWPAAKWRDIHVVVGVSGGPDSTALLRGLLAVKQDAGGAGRLLAGHVNHQLRGETSAADEQWLRELCAELGVPLSVQRAETAALAKQQGDGLEAAAREARYRLLTEMAEKAGARYVAVGHTLDDQVETALFRLLRGTGLLGLSGMRVTRPLSASVTLVRPIMACRRDEVLAYLKELGQAFREDPTNANFDFTRNRIRRDLLPYLREHFNADVDGAIIRLAAQARETQDVVESLGGQLLAKCHPRDREAASGRVAELEVAPLLGQPNVLVCEALRQTWRSAGFSEQAMTRLWWHRLAELVQREDAGAVLNLPGNLRARLHSDTLMIMRGASDATSSSEAR